MSRMPFQTTTRIGDIIPPTVAVRELYDSIILEVFCQLLVFIRPHLYIVLAPTSSIKSPLCLVLSRSYINLLTINHNATLENAFEPNEQTAYDPKAAQLRSKSAKKLDNGKITRNVKIFLSCRCITIHPQIVETTAKNKSNYFNLT